MNCGRAQQRLSSYLEGLLPPREAEALTTHLRDCPACRRLQDIFATISADLQTLPDPTPPADLAHRLAARCTSESEGSARVTGADAAGRRFPRQPLSWPWIMDRLRVPLAASAVVAVVGLLALILTRGGHRPIHTAAGSKQPVPTVIATAPSAEPSARERLASPGRPLQEPGLPARAALRTGSPRSPARSLPLIERPQRPGEPASGSSDAASPSLPSRADDLQQLNGEPVREIQRWISLRPDEWEVVEERVRQGVRVRDDFVQIPFPRLAARSERPLAAAVESYRREAAVVDPRLAREVTVQQKATALSDLCERLRADTGISLTAGRSVADEKVTLFCQRMPLRDVMRQLSRPFGYTWLRASRDGAYCYELTQDLKSQLMEEELRNRDRHAALLALEQEIERYRPYLHLSPDEALARAETAGPGEKELLRKLAGKGWGPLQIYPRLSAQELAAMRAGQELTFSEAPQSPAGGNPSQPLPAWLAGGVLPREVGQGVLQSMRNWRLVDRRGGYEYAPDGSVPGALPPAQVPSARGFIRLRIIQSEPGHFTLKGRSGLYTIGSRGEVFYSGSGEEGLATGTGPSLLKPDNASLTKRLAGEPSLQRRVTVVPGSRQPARAGSADNEAAASRDKPPVGAPYNGWARPIAPERWTPTTKVTTADLLEAVHRATGMPLIADYYTRLYAPEVVSAKNQPLRQLLNTLCDATRMRWDKQGEWLQFRTTSFYDDRLKEVPNRLLTRWAAARQGRGSLTLDELCEIAGLPDAQLDGREMAEGARELWGLLEWTLPRYPVLRPHLRYLASFSPAHRQEAAAGALPFTKMSLAQQQQFLAFAMQGSDTPLQSLDEFSGAALRVEYTQPGGFQWGEPGWSGFYSRYVIPLEPGPTGRRAPRPLIYAPTRDQALAAVRRVDPKLREALFRFVRHHDPRAGEDQAAFEEAQIFPTQLDLQFVYIPGATNARALMVLGPRVDGTVGGNHR